MRGDIFFVCTDERCVVDGIDYPDIPIFFCSDGVIQPFSEYMIYRCYEVRVSPNSGRTYAYYLQKLLKYLQAESVPWNEVTDRVLTGWRDRMMKHEGLSGSTVAAYLAEVLAFYRWAEERGRVVGSIPIPLLEGREDQRAAGRYRISVKKARDGGGFVWAGTPRQESKVNRHTPTPEEIDELHAAASSGGTPERDTLLLSLYEELCLRRAEALSLDVEDIPDRLAIEEAQESDVVFALKITGKGNKTRIVPMLPELAMRAREYIEGERSEVVQRARQRDPRFREPDALFLADTTARPLTKQHVSRRISKLMKDSGIENASGHRLRAAGLTALAQAYDGIDDTGAPYLAEQVLWKVAERAGHAHPNSLRPYLDLARSRNAMSDKEWEIREAGRERLSRRGKLLRQHGG